jgi:hypothetical protein
MKEKQICKNCGKEKIIHARRLCKSCYDNLYYNGLIDGVVAHKCKVDGCEKSARADGYCQRHYTQVWKYGKISEGNTNRSKMERNEIIKDIENNIAYIILYNSKQEEKERTIIDLEDIDKIKSYKWNCNKSSKFHVSTITKDGNLMLHRLIMNCTDDSLVVDHINHNPLDNRKCNLRICTNEENRKNNSLYNTNTTGIIGIYYIKKRNIWQSSITVNTKLLLLGEFNNKEDAIRERLKGEVYYMKEFAPQQHLYEEYGIDKNAEYEVKQYKPRKKGNEYGIKGVFKGSGNNKDKWKVEFKVDGKNIFLGHYDILEEAIAIRQAYKG